MECCFPLRKLPVIFHSKEFQTKHAKPQISMVSHIFDKKFCFLGVFVIFQLNYFINFYEAGQEEIGDLVYLNDNF